MLRAEVKESDTVYIVPEGGKLSPSARDFLTDRKIQILKAENACPGPSALFVIPDADAEPFVPKYTDYLTGAYYTEKPEHMTALSPISGNALVAKDNPRIVLRGQLDSLQAQIIAVQAELAAANANGGLINDLDDVLNYARILLRAEVMEEVVPDCPLLGLSPTELRQHSHNPQKYYGVKQMVLPCYKYGVAYAKLNLLRAKTREVETTAVTAFGKDSLLIIRSLNRLSSCFHIMMCKLLGNKY